VPEEIVKKNFDRVLKTVQDTARSQVGKDTGKTVTVLVEEVNEHDSSLMTGRMSNNTLVHFPGTVDLIGQFVEVKLEKCNGFYYFGSQMQ
ncbi:MAG: TRAM domain-containing protein, partial [Lachnospiraceae bacterium]|nr:TRAM domain-containing protein [Lachnospiraceae bacterium]